MKIKLTFQQYDRMVENIKKNRYAAGGVLANYSTNSGKDRTEYKKKSSIFNLVDRI